MLIFPISGEALQTQNDSWMNDVSRKRAASPRTAAKTSAKPITMLNTEELDND
jgi:hypothetical protein